MRKMSMQYLHKYGESIQAMTQQIKTGDKWATSHKSCFPAYGARLINPGYGFSSGKLVRNKAEAILQLISNSHCFFSKEAIYYKGAFINYVFM